MLSKNTAWKDGYTNAVQLQLSKVIATDMQMCIPAGDLLALPESINNHNVKVLRNKNLYLHSVESTQQGKATKYRYREIWGHWWISKLLLD